MERVSASAGIEKNIAKKAADAVLTGIVESAKSGEEVNFPGFGKFKTRQVPPRQGRNPSTGEAIEVTASRKMTFAPAKQVKDALAE
ncbi:HU family DNA-binding protein [Roseomonas chloroacetimidivorans]|uniref:HU family DNA-binding protein n=1 Tax=Roseomonas chloroacetimidivorans TaxID=1766656 RepID=UPI003C73FA01